MLCWSDLFVLFIEEPIYYCTLALREVLSLQRRNNKKSKDMDGLFRLYDLEAIRKVLPFLRSSEQNPPDTTNVWTHRPCFVINS